MDNNVVGCYSRSCVLRDKSLTDLERFKAGIYHPNETDYMNTKKPRIKCMGDLAYIPMYRMGLFDGYMVLKAEECLKRIKFTKVKP